MYDMAHGPSYYISVTIQIEILGKFCRNFYKGWAWPKNNQLDFGLDYDPDPTVMIRHHSMNQNFIRILYF